MEVRNDFIYDTRGIDGISTRIDIDYWETDNEEGKTVATVILTEHKDIVVVYIDNQFRLNSSVTVAICEAIEKIKNI